MARRKAEAGVKLSRKEKTREMLVLAAGRVFKHHGLNATTVEMILVEAGAARATFYQHFSDKNELVRALIASVWRQGDSLYSDFANLPAVDRPTLRAWFARVHEAWRQHYAEVEILLRDVPAEIESQSGRHMDDYVGLVVGDGARWACSIEQARCRAHLLIGQLERALLDVHRGAWPVEEDLLLDTLVTLWDKALHEA